MIYDEAVRESAQVRVDLALSAVAARGHRGERRSRRPRSVPRRRWTPSPQRRPDEIIVSTHPATQLGLAAPRPDRADRNASGLPVEHIVTDLEQEGLPFKVTLVVANKTSSGEELIEHLRAKAAGERTRTCSSPWCPQQDGSGGAPREARARLASDARPAAAAPACSARA